MHCVHLHRPGRTSPHPCFSIEEFAGGRAKYEFQSRRIGTFFPPFISTACQSYQQYFQLGPVNRRFLPLNCNVQGPFDHKSHYGATVILNLFSSPTDNTNKRVLSPAISSSALRRAFYLGILYPGSCKLPNSLYHKLGAIADLFILITIFQATGKFWLRHILRSCSVPS